MYKASGTENLRAKPAAPASKVADGGTGRGTPCGGTGSPRAQHRALPSAIPGAGPGGARSTQGRPYTDGTV